ncbi:MAG TPA: hypothetical protein DCE41_21180 [Cytophagales bacterium]|nr:hypothetical protein [Cytophagales bacterium]HAA19024.1 hypothetical protein [Cytophagales bacterium]HAP63201.1 hypothetical protein [Cytophagales bacterium]
MADSNPNAWITLNDGTIAEINETGIVNSFQLDGKDISVGDDGTVWVLVNELTLDPNGSGNDYLPGYGLYNNVSGEFKRLPDVTGIRLDASWQADVCYVVKENGSVWTVSKDGAQNVVAQEDTAYEVSAGPDGTIWVVSREAIEGGALVKYLEPGYDPAEPEWKAVPGVGATRITGQPNGKAMIVDGGGFLSRIDKEGNIEGFPVGDTVFEASMGPGGNLWAIMRNTESNTGRDVMLQTGGEGEWVAWKEIPGDINAGKIDAGGQHTTADAE